MSSSGVFAREQLNLSKWEIPITLDNNMRCCALDFSQKDSGVIISKAEKENLDSTIEYGDGSWLQDIDRQNALEEFKENAGVPTVHAGQAPSFFLYLDSSGNSRVEVSLAITTDAIDFGMPGLRITPIEFVSLQRLSIVGTKKSGEPTSSGEFEVSTSTNEKIPEGTASAVKGKTKGRPLLRTLSLNYPKKDIWQQGTEDPDIVMSRCVSDQSHPAAFLSGSAAAGAHHSRVLSGVFTCEGIGASSGSQEFLLGKEGGISSAADTPLREGQKFRRKIHRSQSLGFIGFFMRGSPSSNQDSVYQVAGGAEVVMQRSLSRSHRRASPSKRNTSDVVIPSAPLEAPSQLSRSPVCTSEAVAGADRDKHNIPHTVEAAAHATGSLGGVASSYPVDVEQQLHHGQSRSHQIGDVECSRKHSFPDKAFGELSGKGSSKSFAGGSPFPHPPQVERGHEVGVGEKWHKLQRSSSHNSVPRLEVDALTASPGDRLHDEETVLDSPATNGVSSCMLVPNVMRKMIHVKPRMPAFGPSTGHPPTCTSCFTSTASLSPAASPRNASVSPMSGTHAAVSLYSPPSTSPSSIGTVSPSVGTISPNSTLQGIHSSELAPEGYRKHIGWHQTSRSPNRLRRTSAAVTAASVVEISSAMLAPSVGSPDAVGSPADAAAALSSIVSLDATAKDSCLLERSPTFGHAQGSRSSSSGLNKLPSPAKIQSPGRRFLSPPRAAAPPRPSTAPAGGRKVHGAEGSGGNRSRLSGSEQVPQKEGEQEPLRALAFPRPDALLLEKWELTWLAGRSSSSSSNNMQRDSCTVSSPANSDPPEASVRTADATACSEPILRRLVLETTFVGYDMLRLRIDNWRLRGRQSDGKGEEIPVVNAAGVHT